MSLAPIVSGAGSGMGEGPREETHSRGPRNTGEPVVRDRRGRAPPPSRPLVLLPHVLPPSVAARALTDEEDGKGDEEQEDMWHHVERVHEAAVVEDTLVYPVGS